MTGVGQHSVIHLADSSIAGNFSFELNRDFNSSLLANHMEEGIIPCSCGSESHFARIPRTA